MNYTDLFAQHDLPAPTDAQAAQLAAYVALLLKWNKAINLIGRSTASDVVERHVLDSAQVAALLPEDARTVLDVGAGAGLPSVMIAILCPEITVTACEINGKKASFINTARRELGLENLRVENADVKQLNLPPQEVITARAFAELKDILAWTEAYIGAETMFVLPKGARWQAEVAAAQPQLEALAAHGFPMTMTTVSSITVDRQNKGGEILILRTTREQI